MEWVEGGLCYDMVSALDRFYSFLLILIGGEVVEVNGWVFVRVCGLDTYSVTSVGEGRINMDLVVVFGLGCRVVVVDGDG